MDSWGKGIAGTTSGLSMLLLCLAMPHLVEAGRESRPFWAEKSAYIEGEDLFVVGVASKAKSLEEGRQQAFERGKIELMNFAQVATLEAQGLVIETQMTYEEVNPDETFTVFRLLRVPSRKLGAIQERLRAQSRIQEQALEKTSQELVALQQTLTRKQSEIEAQTRSIQTNLTQITELQAKLSEKTQRIDQQQHQVEQLLKQLTDRLQIGRPQEGSSVLDTLKQAEIQLDERERELDGLSRRIKERVQATSQKACKYVALGMKKSDVRTLLGGPEGPDFSIPGRGVDWVYGTTTLSFAATEHLANIHGCKDR